MNQEDNVDIYYKYSKYYGKENLTTIKLSSPLTLNDPFEGIINDDAYSNLKTTELNTKHLKYIFNQALIDEIKEDNLKKLIGTLGIVSLSETPRNLLMWAHYADEHRGICIGYKPELLKNCVYNDGIKTIAPMPEKVNYDIIRPDIKQNCNDETNTATVQKEIKDQLLTKGDEWIYEKEHRFIIPMTESDYLMFNPDKSETPYKIEPFINEGHITEETISFCKKERKIYKSDQMRLLVDDYYQDKEAIFLKNINPENIVSIHFGARFDLNEMNEIIEEIKNPNSPLKHIKLFTCTRMTTRFALAVQPINIE